MKRVRSACIEQTIHFQLKPDAPQSFAVQQVKEECELYKKRLEQSHTKYRILSEETQPDGSIIVSVKKQMNGYDVGSYLD